MCDVHYQEHEYHPQQQVMVSCDAWTQNTKRIFQLLKTGKEPYIVLDSFPYPYVFRRGIVVCVIAGLMSQWCIAAVIITLRYIQHLDLVY